jgi:hypothetical protein
VEEGRAGEGLDDRDAVPLREVASGDVQAPSRITVTMTTVIRRIARTTYG